MRRLSLLLCAAMLLVPLVLLAQPSYEYFSRPGWFRAFAYPLPSTPANMSAVQTTPTVISLYWDASTLSGGTLDRYDIYWCQPSPCTPTLQATSETNSYEAVGLTDSVVYEFAVTAVNTEGRASDLSAEAVASLDDLVAHYTLDSDGTDAAGVSNCTVNGDPTFVAGLHSDGLWFDGTGDYCVGSHNAVYDTAAALTVMALIDCNSMCGTADQIVNRSNGSTSRAFELRVGGSITQGTFAIYDDTNTARTVSATNAIPASGIVLLAGTFDGANLRFYQNGTHRSTQAFAGVIGQPTQGISIGARSNGQEPFVGFINEPYVWRRTLTTADIRAMYFRLLAQQVSSTSLASYQVMGDYPRALWFRRETTSQSSYAAFKNEFGGRLYGIIRKAFNEESESNNQATAIPYMQQLAEDYPGEAVILHFNGNARDPMWRPDDYFPGHWLYLPGSIVNTNLDTDDTVIPVDDGTKFKINIGLTNDKGDDIIIVRLDGSGDPIWEESEYATVSAINTNDLTVVRGQYGSTPLTYTSGDVYVAPLVNEGPWGVGPRLIWRYNLGINAPEDGDGNTAADVLSNELASYLAPGGELDNIAGLELDISRDNLNNVQAREVDINFDGTGDRGTINGINEYGVGVANLYRLLREKIGADKFILGDGGIDGAQRSVPYAGGIESEGWDAPNRVYEEWSKAINIHNYWNTHGIYRPQLNYVAHRDSAPNGGTEAGKERMIIGASACIGSSFSTLIITPATTGYTLGLRDELVKGVSQERGWLGAPVGSVIYPATSGTDVFNGQTFTPSVTDGTVETIGTTYSLSDPVDDDMVLSFADLDIPEGDLLVTLEARSYDPLPGGYARSIPRKIWVELEGKEASTHQTDTVMGYMGIGVMTPLAFYFRDAGAVTTGSTVTLNITIEGGGTLNRDPFAHIRNIKAYAGPQAMACEFEEGAILVNPGLDDYDFDLSTLFPGKAYAKITATSLQDTSYNDGSAVSGTVTVPGLNALFLDRTH